MQIALVLAFALAAPSLVAGQTAQPDQISHDVSPATAPQPVPSVDRAVSWKLLGPNVLSDQRRIWTFPIRLVRGRNWIPTAAVLGTTAALVALDPREGAYFHRTTTYQRFNNIFSGNATGIGIIAVPSSLYFIGLSRKDSKMQRTALLAGEALADSEILTLVFKSATKRVRPANISTHGNYSDNWFENTGSFFSGNGSFPSGHTIAAFSVATVVARRYGNHRWIPYAAYGMATLVGFSRLSLSAHFASDVFVGAALGYAISRFTVLQH
jgi:hypothetical protein